MTELFAHKTAIVSGNIEITYQQLEWMSNAIAAKLKQNELVAVVMEKGWEQIAAVLGILKAGAAYLPIDANLPVQRIHSLLEIGDVQSVLCQQHTKECVDELISVQSIEIGSEYLGVAPHQRVNSILADTDLAYVIFTSGSTGIPKGVMIDHRGAINTIFDINNRFSITENDTVLALSALNFDLSVYDIFGILGVGGKIVLPPADKVNDAEVWSELVNIHKVTVWNSVPALMQMWIDTVCDRQLIIESPLRTVMMSGDWIPLDLPTRIQKMFDGVNIYSLGGATEASIWSIYYPIERVEDKWTSIPYGKPMENQTFNVLKSDLSECPEQVVGDLYIGGIGLAKGYFKDPEKTKVSFIKHPNTGEILYRTGDMGRYLADGNIEFLGREDAQVKVNGYRIELGEIESIVKQHELVKHVVVNAFGEKFDKKLIAYLVLSNNNISFDKVKEDITQLISGALPHYMIPAGFIAIDNIPLTANGKVNRDELPVPDLMQEQADDIVYSENETERKLCAIWSETLGLEVQNVESDFFLLGGDSLQAAKIISAIRNEFDLDSDKFQITTFFEKPTIKAIAENIIAYKRIEKLNDGLLNLTEADEEIEEGMI
jgi:yersiniabactin nonribosomal peptide synthetase